MINLAATPARCRQPDDGERGSATVWRMRADATQSITRYYPDSVRRVTIPVPVSRARMTRAHRGRHRHGAGGVARRPCGSATRQSTPDRTAIAHRGMEERGVVDQPPPCLGDRTSIGAKIDRVGQPEQDAATVRAR